MDAPAKRGRGVPVALGILAIVVAVLWALLWGTVALLASAFGSDGSGWLVVSVALVAGLLLFVLGVCVIRGRPPSRVGWLVVGGAAAALFAMPVGAVLDEREAAPVNRAAARAYVDRTGEANVEAHCDMVFERDDGTEFWECSFESLASYEICQVDVRHQGERIVPRIRECV